MRFYTARCTSEYMSRAHCRSRSTDLASRRIYRPTPIGAGIGRTPRYSRSSANCWRWQVGRIAAKLERNLREAEEWQKDCARLVRHPELGGQGTGCDPQSRRRDLKEARDEVAYRKKLLVELAAKETADER